MMSTLLPPSSAEAVIAAQDVPCVWVVASHRELGNEAGNPQRYTVVDDGGSRALLNLGLQPVCFPHVPAGRLPAVLRRVHGVLLGGSATNVHPRHYGEEPLNDELEYDEGRDSVSLPLVRLCIEQRVPLIAFCRGIHELNVAMGGSLHQRLQALGGPVVHWENPQDPLERQYADRHAVSLLEGGELQRITGCSRFAVSSLHSQGIHRLAPGLVAEALADDGLVEAVRWQDASQFAWGFQFHPEWGHQGHACYGRILEAFVQACWAAAGAQR